MDEKGTWKLAPAYDLTFSSGPNGEQSTMVMGEGRNPKISHLVKLGQEAKLAKKLIEEIIDQTASSLSGWKDLAKKYHVTKVNIELIAKAINRNK
jgi:serine/threonine-protein kinase HipA